MGQQAKIGLGKLEEHAAPALGLVPGIGPLLAAGIAAHGRTLDTTHGSVGLGDIAKAGIGGGAGGLAVGGIAGALGHVPGLSGLASHIPGMGSAAGSVGGAASAAAPAAAGAAGAAAGAAPAASGGFLGSLGSFLGSHGMTALELAQGANAAVQGQKANSLANKALHSSEQAYQDRAPLRQAGISGMLHPQVPGLSALNRSGPNPYAQQQGGY